jgi:glycosyltransferase involved in cell wall biosynthesis
MDSFKGVKICFLADKHDLYDDRIYWKMAVPMKRFGAEVYYYSIGPEADEGITEEGIIYRVWKVKTFSKNPFVNFAIKRLNPSNNYKKLFDACAVLKADIYHFHDLWLNRIGPGLKALPHRPAVFYDAREPYAEDYRSFSGSGRFATVIVDIFASGVDRWEKKMAMSYDRVIANESKVRNEFAKVIGEERAVVLYNYLDRDLFAADLEEVKDRANYGKLQDSTKKYDLLYCGLLTEQRGAWNLMNAVRALKPTMPELKVLLIGKIQPPELREEMQTFIIRHDLQNTIEMKAQVPHEQVGKYYKDSRVGLLLWQPIRSLKIKMPIKLFEYMAFGLPLVGSNFGHIAELIRKESCGLLVDPGNLEEVVQAIKSLLQKENMYAAMSNQGIEATHREFNWQLEMDRLCNYYKTALNER